MASGGTADSPEPKRRLESLMGVTGLSRAVDITTAAPAERDSLLRIHPAAYLDAFKRLSDAGGGALHPTAPFGADSYEIAALSAGLVQGAVLDVASGRRHAAYAVSRPSGHHCLPDLPLGFCFLANVAIAIEEAVTEELAGLRTDVVDPFLELIEQQQPSAAFDEAQMAALRAHPAFRT